MKVTWRTVSNALEKSKPVTYRQSYLVDNMSHTVWNKATSAAVVDPVGLNAYWSEKQSVGGGC